MTHDEMEVRIKRLEEVVEGFLSLRELLESVQSRGEDLLQRHTDMMALLNELRMDLAKKEDVK